MRLQEFTFEVEYLPGPENVLADHLSRNMDFPHVSVGSITAIPGHLAFAAAAKALNVWEFGADVLEPEAWRAQELQELWQSGTADAVESEPCTVCGEAEGYAHMVLCDTCNRPFHIQSCHPPRSVVPPGDWHCFLCDGAFEAAHLTELRSDDDPVLFARSLDPFHTSHADQIAEYVKLYNMGVRDARRAAGDGECDSDALDRTGRRAAETALSDVVQSNAKPRLRRMARALRVHPTQPEWYVTESVLRSGQRLWLAIPLVEYRWGLIGAYHDQLGHAGVNQTQHAMRQHYTWHGMKEDVAACVLQCHQCQVRHLKMEKVVNVTTPRMSEPMEHVHNDLAGLFEVKAVRDDSETSPRRRKSASSITTQGKAWIAIVVDYFTKAAEFVAIPDKRAATVARAFHDRWLARYGCLEWVTSDNGTEFAGAFAHQLLRFGIEHVHTSARHRVRFHCVMLHPRHADVAPARALAAPCGALQMWC